MLLQAAILFADTGSAEMPSYEDYEKSLMFE